MGERPGATPRAGSAFLWTAGHGASARLVVVTAWHLVGNAQHIQLGAYGFSVFLPTKVLGASPALDVAVLELPTEMAESAMKLNGLLRIDDGPHPLLSRPAPQFSWVVV